MPLQFALTSPYDSPKLSKTNKEKKQVQYLRSCPTVIIKVNRKIQTDI